MKLNEQRTRKRLLVGCSSFKVKKRRILKRKLLINRIDAIENDSRKMSPYLNQSSVITSTCLLFLFLAVIPLPQQMNLTFGLNNNFALAANTDSSKQANFLNSTNQTTNLIMSQTMATTTEVLLNLVKTNFNANSSGPANHRLAPFKPRLGQQREHLHYKTTYACEGNQLELSCEEGKLIHLVRANYGRLSLSVCNELGDSNLSVQCYSFRAFLIMENRCNKLSNCSVIASKELFGDPCEGTSKYLEVQYYCYDANASTNSVQQTPQSIAQQQQVISALNRQIDQPATPTHKPQPAIDGVASGAELEAEPASGEPANVIAKPAQLDPQLYCAPQRSAHNLYWNYTRRGQVARQTCPDGFSGTASWSCDAQAGRFLPAWSPDFSQCRSVWIQRLAQQLEQLLKWPQTTLNRPQVGDFYSGQQNEIALKALLNDLAIKARTTKLFSEDLRRIDLMIGQIIAHLKSLGLNSWRAQTASMSQMYEVLFGKIVDIVSSLFDLAQRNAWLEMPSLERKRLEQRYLNHLRDSGLLIAPMNALDQLPLRQTNVFAGITVINNLNSRSQLDPDNDFNLQLKQLQSSTKSVDPENQINEFKVHSQLLRELLALGITRFLVLDVKKPDYSLIKQQLESNDANPALDNNNNLPTDQQLWSSRIFGIFALVGENGDNALDAQNQLEFRLANLLSQWPISVDFRVQAQTANLLSPVNQQQQWRQCNSLSDNVNQPNRCHTLKSNATNHICSCDHFGFVLLNNLADSNVMAENQWTQLSTGSANPYELAGYPPQGGSSENAYIGAQNKQQSMGIWASIFIFSGLSLLVVSLIGLIVSALMRASSQSSLNKNFGSILSHQGPTTGPLTDHSLLGTEPIVSNNTNSTQSTSIMGLTQSAYGGYKSHQQLYATHLPSVVNYGSSSSKWARCINWLRPSRWISGATKANDIQHRVMANGSVAYKSQFQNGYTTGLHQAAGQMQLAPPSSSTSSYVSSSAYYEEIGPGNLTKVSSSQLTNPHPHTIVEPFKRSADQQQLIHQQPMWTNSYMEAQQVAAQQNCARTLMQNKQQIHSDLSQLQAPHSQSSSSSSGQSTQQTSASPRHYLFASPTIYKSSISQQTLQQQQQQLHYHHHHQQQFKEPHRFLPSN